MCSWSEVAVVGFFVKLSDEQCVWMTELAFLRRTSPQYCFGRRWNMMAKGPFPECPGCGNAYRFRLGSSEGFGCDVVSCSWGVATTYSPEICRDPTVYSLYIDALPDTSLRSVARLALQLGIPSSEAREQIRNLPVRYASGEASEVFALRHKLESEGYVVSIQPTFPYDVFDPNPQGKFPLSTEEIEAFQAEYSENNGVDF